MCCLKLIGFTIVGSIPYIEKHFVCVTFSRASSRGTMSEYYTEGFIIWIVIIRDLANHEWFVMRP